jgi:hypothetical protein
MAFFGMKKIDFLFTKGDNFRYGELGKKEKKRGDDELDDEAIRDIAGRSR